MSGPIRTVIRAERAFVGGRWDAVDVTVSDDTVSDIMPLGSGDAALSDVHLLPPGAVLLPGLVDCHVHIDDPGRAHWEGFASATLAAAAGGVTTLVDMPLNSIPPTTSVGGLEAKRRATEGKLAVDVGFWGGAVPENLGSLHLLHEAGVFGFKCFLSPSGVDEFDHLDARQLRAALAEVAALGSVLLVHAEDPALVGASGPLGRRYADFVASRPPASERAAVADVIRGVRETGARAHILHLSDAGSLPLIAAAKAEGLPVTVETCPHYLVLHDREIPDGASEFKCCPPIRDAGNRDALWDGIVDGLFDAVVSDHSPSTVERKREGGGDFGLAWGGISGLQVGFATTWTEARRRGVPLDAIVPLFTSGPARIAGLAGFGEIAVGGRADLAVFAPDEVSTIDAHTLHHRNPVSAFHGRTTTGRVEETWLRGRPIHRPGEGETTRGGVALDRRNHLRDDRPGAAVVAHMPEGAAR